MVKFAQLPKYEAYKDSGVEWLGEIPKYWNVRKLKYLLKEVNHRSEDGKENLLSVSQYTGVTLRSNKLSEGDLLTNAESLEGYKIVKVNDLVSNIMLAWNGSLGFSNYDGIVSPAYAVYRLNAGLDQQFFHYLLRTDLYKAEYKRQSTGVIESRLRLYTDSFYDIFGLLPSAVEQTLIAKFLDQKTAQIDAAIAIKEQQIELLKERKKIIIQQAVTQGLDPNAPMKNSGVEWIGQIPEHWLYEPVKYSLKGIIDCEHKTAPFVDEEEYFVARTTNVKDGVLTLSGAKYTTEKGFKEWTRRGVPVVGDVLLTREAPAGEACVIPSDLNLCLGQRMVWLKVDNARLLSEFAVALIYSTIGRTYIDFLSSGSTVLHLNMADIGNIPVLLPPIEEQLELVRYISELTDETNRTVKIQADQIEKLKEYKTTLINSAVTGKIKITPEMLQA